MSIDRAPAGVKAPAERKVYPKIHFIAVPVSLVSKPTTRTEIQKTVQTIVIVIVGVYIWVCKVFVTSKFC